MPGPAPADWLVTATDMRAIEARAAERGETAAVLMDRAARRVAAVVAERMRASRGRDPMILVLVGPGNNGGDGLWAARYLRERAVPAVCYLWHRPADRPDAVRAAAAQAGVPIYHAEADPGGQTLARLLAEAEVVLDALLGFGLQRDVAGDLYTLIAAVDAAVAAREAAARPVQVFAVDLPTGIDSDTGAVRGLALPAHVTITLGLAKRGLYTFPGAAHAGEILLEDIGVRDLTDQLQVATLTDAQMRTLLPARPADAHKGTFGSVLIVAGSLNYIGAGVLATQGALRAGVGLATLATPLELLSVAAAKLTECTFLPLPADLGVLTDRAVAPLLKALDERAYTALLIGNGLGREKETLQFMRRLLEDPGLDGGAGVTAERHVGFSLGRPPAEAPKERDGARRVGFGLSRRPAAPAKDTEKVADDSAPKDRRLPPLVIDADGLNLLAEIVGWSGRLPTATILTPHPGEMARLLDRTVEAVQADRVEVARQAAAAWQAIVVLKGAHTVIAAPDGQVRVNPVATAALATAGTGDVLAGCIAGLLAQGLAPFDAATAGVYVHGRAGQIVAAELGDAGPLAGDVAEALPLALREIKEQEA